MAKRDVFSETGILRKKDPEEKHQDLLVFGYACKLFRDDEKALYIDQGKHLIPWLGDENIKIDRYDGRGALSELSSYEAHHAHFDSSERHLEARLDEERYYSLNHDEEELEMYQEEELKRLGQTGNQVRYTYDVPANPEHDRSCQLPEDERPFVPPLQLDLPSGIRAPSTHKENARIEKTACFVNNHGLQMEILIKTKQADNPQFSFLTNTDQLYPYYKHLLAAIKSGQYKIESASSNDNDDKQNVTNESENEPDESQYRSSHYLHPSLQATLLQPAPPPLPTVNYKPSPDCSYYQLVNRIQGGVQTEHFLPPPTQLTSQHQQYYYPTQCYDYFNRVAQYRSQNSDDRQAGDQFRSKCDDYSQCEQSLPSTVNLYTQIVSTVSKELSPATRTHQLVLATENDAIVDSRQESINGQKSSLSLVQYGSDSESEEEPPEDLKQIIDKMAAYVLKNGSDFEHIVKERADSRFDFLRENHKYHVYYMSKLAHNKRIQTVEDKQKGVTTGISQEISQSNSIKTKEKRIIAPVSFSIKKSKDEVPKEIKSALPVEESDDETDINLRQSQSISCELTPQVIGASRTHSETVLVPISNNGNFDETLPSLPSSREIREGTPVSVESYKPSEDAILDLIDLTDENDDERTERRSGDKLALQLERKRKAAAFLKLKSKESSRDERQDSLDVVLRVDDSESAEEGEIKKHKKDRKKKKSRKRKRSRSCKRESRYRKSREHRKSSKKHKRNRANYSSDSSTSSQR